MSKLNTITAPSLNDSKFGDNIKKQFENINDNFQKLSNYDFTKGEKGDSIDFVDIKLAEDEELRKSILSLLLVYRSEHIDSEKDGENVEEKFSEAVSFNIESYLLNSTIRMIKLKDDYVGSLPFVYVDERFHHENVLDDINENPGLYDDEIDLSCIILFENDQFKIVQNFPSLYYDQQVKGLCWKWLGKETAVPANGPQGATGKSTQLLISKIESVSGDGIVLVEAISYNGNWIQAGKNVDINNIHSDIGIPAGEDLVNWPTIVIVDGNNDTESVDTDNSDDESVDTDRSYIYLSNFQKLYDEESGKDYYYVACTNDNRLDLGFNIKSLWEEMIEEPLDKMGIALPTYDGGDDPIDFNDKNIKPMHLLYTDPSTGSLTLNKGEIQKGVPGSEYKYEINGVTDRDGKNLIKEGLFNVFYDTIFHYGENKNIRLEKGNIKVSNATKNTTITPGHISTQNLETHTLRIEDSTGERSSLTVNSTERNLISSTKYNSIEAKNNTIEADEINTISAGKNNIEADEVNTIKAKNNIIEAVGDPDTNIVGVNTIKGEVEISGKTTIENELDVTTKITSPLITDKDENVSIELSDNIGIKYKENKIISEIISIGRADNDKYSIFASKDKLRIGKIDVDFFNKLSKIQITISANGLFKYAIQSDLFNNYNNKDNNRICVSHDSNGRVNLFGYDSDGKEVEWKEIDTDGILYWGGEDTNITVSGKALRDGIKGLTEASISIVRLDQQIPINENIKINILFNFVLGTSQDTDNPQVTDNPQGHQIILPKTPGGAVDIVTINEDTHFEYTKGEPAGNHEVEINGKLKIAGKTTTDNKRISLELGGAIKNSTKNIPVEVIGGIKSDKGYTKNGEPAGKILMANGDVSAKNPINIDFGGETKSADYSNGIFNIDLDEKKVVKDAKITLTQQVQEHDSAITKININCDYVQWGKIVTLTLKSIDITWSNISGGAWNIISMLTNTATSLPKPAIETVYLTHNVIYRGTGISDDDSQAGLVVALHSSGKVSMYGLWDPKASIYPATVTYICQ